MSAPNENLPHSGPVLLFDGECGLCNRVVRLLLRLDRRGVMRFAPLQGPTAQSYLRRHDLPLRDFDSLIYVPDWVRREHAEYRQRTDGVVAALQAIGGVTATVLGSIRFLPRGWRDALYKLVARWRYRLFGEWTDRPLPRVEWKTRFLE